MQIGAQGLENMLVTSIIHDYGMLKKHKTEKTPFHSLDLIQDQFWIESFQVVKNGPRMNIIGSKYIFSFLDNRFTRATLI
jgi:hypothetical protein